MKLINQLREQIQELKKSLDSIDTLLKKNDLKSAYVVGKTAIKNLFGLLLALKKNSKYVDAHDVPLPEASLEDKSESMVQRRHRTDAFVQSFFRNIANWFREVFSYSLSLLSYLYRGFLIWKKPIIGLVVLIGGVWISTFTYSAIRYRHNGINGEYFRDRKLSKKVFERVDKNIDFRWCRRGPSKKVGRNNFSVRWTGYLDVPEETQYEILTLSDDGVRLWINDRQLIDDWRVHDPYLNSADIKLGIGLHKIKVEYFERGRSAMIKLFWRKKGEKEKKVIHRKYFYPSIERAKIAKS